MKTYESEFVIAHDDNSDDVIEKINKVLSRQMIALVEKDSDHENGVQTYRMISQGSDDWGYNYLYGHVLDRAYTKEERYNLS